MKTFDQIWGLLAPKAEYANRKHACYDLWQSFEADKQEAVYATIMDKKAKGLFVDFNPLFALRRFSQDHQQVLSYNDYYSRFGTTEEKDGWKMANPTGNRVIYVKG